MIEAIDSHFEAVSTRITAINPQRKIVALMDAMDWPPQAVEMDAFYCLTVGFSPAAKGTWSPSSPIVSHVLQWVWINQGTDIQSGLRGRNRGDRYRTSFAMQEELLQGLYPHFTEKLVFSVDAQGNVQTASMNPKDYVFWTMPRVLIRSDQQSGLVYGSAAVNLVNITDAVLNP